MKKTRLILSLCLLAASLAAQVRRSTRNIKPLTGREQPVTPGAMQGGYSGIGIAAPGQAAAPVTAKSYTRVLFSGPEQGWGIVKSEAPYYSLAGKYLGKLSGGTLFKYNGVKNSTKNSMLVSSVRQGEAWGEPCLLDCATVAGYEGDPEQINPETINDLTAYFTLNSRISEREKKLTALANSANPHLAAAEHSRGEYLASVAQAAEMEKELRTTTGLRREKIMDQLRALKYEQSRLKSKMDGAMAASDAWRAAHPPDPARLSADSQLSELREKRDQVKTRIANLLPTDH